MKSRLTPELIQATIPLFLIFAAMAFGLPAMLVPGLSDTNRLAGMGLASTAIAGAAGLAQSSKQSQQDFSVEKRGDSLKVETPADS